MRPVQALTRVNPAAYSCLAALSQNPRVDIVVGCRGIEGMPAGAPAHAVPSSRLGLNILNACMSGLRMQVISGGEKHRLDEVFSDLPIWLAAENGAVIRPPGAKVRTLLARSSRYYCLYAPQGK